jgi:hypothetical protein
MLCFTENGVATPGRERKFVITHFVFVMFDTDACWNMWLELIDTPRRKQALVTIERSPLLWSIGVTVFIGRLFTCYHYGFRDDCNHIIKLIHDSRWFTREVSAIDFRLVDYTY